jgi:hypothetical protein
MRKSKHSEEKIAMALRQAEAGTPVEEICRKRGVSRFTLAGRFPRVRGSASARFRGAAVERRDFMRIPIGERFETRITDFGARLC